MEVEYVAIQLQALDTYVLVPKEWPVRAHSLLLTLAEKMIAQFDYVSPIVQIYNIPARLICRVEDSGFFYVFNKVAKEEMIGAFIYNILLPEESEHIEVEIFSGNHLDHVPCTIDATRVILYTQQSGRILPEVIGSKFMYRRCLWQNRSQQRKNKCKVCGRVIDNTMNK